MFRLNLSGCAGTPSLSARLCLAWALLTSILSSCSFVSASSTLLHLATGPLISKYSTSLPAFSDCGSLLASCSVALASLRCRCCYGGWGSRSPSGAVWYQFDLLRCAWWPVCLAKRIQTNFDRPTADDKAQTNSCSGRWANFQRGKLDSKPPCFPFRLREPEDSGLSDHCP